jgi:hypothetical protein
MKINIRESIKGFQNPLMKQLNLLLQLKIALIRMDKRGSIKKPQDSLVKQLELL